MPASTDLALSERLGLLRAVCEQHDYFGQEEVVDQQIPLGLAVERYSKEGVPQPGTIVYERWGDQPIIAGMLSEPSRSAALPYVRCAAVVQQSLGTRGVDMLVLLIGPEGSWRDDAWAQAAAAIEDDDRICRKLVWLPADDATMSAEALIVRSPFARPWKGAHAMEAQATTIDSLISDNDVLDDVALKAEATRASALDFVKQALSVSQAK